VDDRNPRRIEDLRAEIATLEESVKGLAHSVVESHPERSLLAFQADWHIRGMLYHFRRLFEHYSAFMHEVSARAGTGASVLIMYAPSFQELLFEFYALVNLCRISLDNLRAFLKPVFTRESQLPKSIRDVLKGETTCPVYHALAGQDLLHYLMDVRNCLVHYRSLATSDNALVLEEGIDATEVVDSGDPFFEAMTRASFRRISERAISVNVYVPDMIFQTDGSGNKKLLRFTYDERWSLLSTARNFTQLAVGSLSLALRCLRDVPNASFQFNARKLGSRPDPPTSAE